MFCPPDRNTRLIASAAPGDWAAALGDIRAPEPLKDHAKGTVYRATLLGRECILKCAPIANPKRRLQALLRRTPARRHWRNALWLRASGIDSAAPLAIVHGEHKKTPIECLVLEFLPGATALDHLAARDHTARAQHRIAEATATLACTLARLGVRNRDPKPSNLIVTELTPNRATLAVIDCADLRPARASLEQTVAGMLASACIEPLGCGLPLRRALCARAIHSAARTLDPDDPAAAARRLWARAAAVVAAHTDPTPINDPLARPLPDRSRHG